MEKVTNGCRIEINESGTIVRFKPGTITGGRALTHDCGTSRSIGYFLEDLLYLAPFAKKPVQITLTGITNDDLDLSVDVIRTVSLPLLAHFGIEEGLELRVTRRGCPPNGGGEVFFSCPTVRHLTPVQLLDVGKIKRIRGISYGARVSPQTINRVVDAARGLLNQFLPDVYLYSDHFRGRESGLSPGFGLSLVGESTTGCRVSVELAANPGTAPEDLGIQCAQLFAEEVSRGGCVDTSHQTLMFMLMTLCPEDVSRVRVGQLSPYSIRFLRTLYEFFGLKFKITPDPESMTVTLACQGIGYVNFAKKAS